MKNIKVLFTLVVCLTILSVVDANAQQVVNNTNCDFLVKIGYALPSDCNNVSYDVVVVPANTTASYTLPAGNEIIEAKGTPGGTGCDFYVGNSCSPYPTMVSLPCPCTSAGNYTAILNTPIDILLQ